MSAAILLMPPLLARFRRWRWNLVRRASPLAYAIVLLFVYVGVAAWLDVNLVFASFLAGFGLAGGIGGGQRRL